MPVAQITDNTLFQMSDYVRNFAELPFHRSELKFGGYIRDDGPCSVSYIRAVAESYGLKVCSSDVSCVMSLYIVSYYR